MNVKQISYGLIGAAMLSGVCSSCQDTKYADNAKNEAVKYLNAIELLKAERFAREQPNPDTYSADEIIYWDSLIMDAKSKEAYIKGVQLINDSVNGIHHRKEKFKPVLDSIMPSTNYIGAIKEEYAKYVNAEDFIKARNNAPNTSGIHSNQLVGTTHYWNLITIAGKQKEAYQKGLENARKNLKK